MFKNNILDHHRFCLKMGILKRFLATTLFLVWVILGVFAENCPIKGCVCESNTITCNNTGITSLPDPSTIPPKYTELVFINNNIREIQNAHYPYVTRLVVKDCSVQKIASDGFVNMTSLQTLDLSENSISNINKEMFQNLTNMTTLLLQGNQLTELKSDSLSPNSMPNLLTLNFEFNQITNVDSEVIMFPLMTYLNIGNNKLSKIPPDSVWKVTTMLETLILHGNTGITSVGDNAFNGLSKLKDLHLDACMISSVSDKAFSGLSSIQQLHLGDNVITKFNVATLEPFQDSIQVLHLYIYKLTTLDGAVENLQRKKLIDLDLWDNPWTCDCSIQWMNQLHTNTTYAKDPKYI